MGFFALCCQCMATLATVKRETNSWKWPLFMFSYMSVLAYIFALALNQIGLRV
jgi:ferrous iron transport protein B